MSRVEEVRLADCFRNGHQVHLKPGAGDLDFADMFRRIEGKGVHRPLHCTRSDRWTT
jgi:sugar phosphate isomerase/epimerase